MRGLQSFVSFYLSAILYLLVNLRLGINIVTTLQATLWQIAHTAPYIAGITYIIIVLLQHMTADEKLSWDRRLRLFWAVGIIAGLVYGIYEYAGVVPESK